HEQAEHAQAQQPRQGADGAPRHGPVECVGGRILACWIALRVAHKAAYSSRFAPQSFPAGRMDTIQIRGARTHNLKNLDLELPRDKLIVITGLSGSGKSSLAFDTIYAEGQRRYVESLSAYARQFLSMMEKPDIDDIQGLSPAISIEQKSTSHNPRSTVGTVTEIYDYLRLLYARAGTPRCPDHGVTLEAQTVSPMVAHPEIADIQGLSPSISIEQNSTSHSPRSTVGTVTEIYDYLRLLYARAGTPRCPDHGVTLEAQTVSQMVDQVLNLPEETRL